jgi:hypothetical protein
MNDFQLLRPRGPDMPAKLPVQRKKKAVPITTAPRHHPRAECQRASVQAKLNPNAAIHRDRRPGAGTSQRGQAPPYFAIGHEVSGEACAPFRRQKKARWQAGSS